MTKQTVKGASDIMKINWVHTLVPDVCVFDCMCI